MSETKWTPGPWKSDGPHVYAPGPEGANICSVGEPRATTIVEYTRLSFGSPHINEAYANLALIAASPSLYAALENLANEVGGWLTAFPELRSVTSNTNFNLMERRVAEARAALAAARGETT